MIITSISALILVASQSVEQASNAHLIKLREALHSFQFFILTDPNHVIREYEI